MTESYDTGMETRRAVLGDEHVDRAIARTSPFTHEFQNLKAMRLGVSTMDLRIAAIAKANRVKLLSRNLRDFRHVPGLDVEDWTV